MKTEYDFSKARRGAVVKTVGNKERITIRLDKDILDWFRASVEKAGGGSYQKKINDALREKMNYHHHAIREDVLACLKEFNIIPGTPAAKRRKHEVFAVR